MLWGLAFRSWEPHHIILIIRWQWITRSGAASLEAGFDNSYLVCDSWRHTEENFNLPKNINLFSFIKRKIIMSDEWCIWYRVLPWQLIHVIRIRANVIRTGLLYDTKSGHKDPDLAAPCQSAWEELVREQRRGERRVCWLLFRVAGGGERCRDHHQDSHGAVEGGNINWYSSKSGIAFFPYTRCIPSPQQHRGRPGKFKYLKESKLTCWADKHFVTKEKVEF